MAGQGAKYESPYRRAGRMDDRERVPVAVLASYALRTFGNIGEGFERVVTTLGFLALSTPGCWSPAVDPTRPSAGFVSAYGLLVGVEGVAIGYAIAVDEARGGGLLGDGTGAAVLGVWIAPVANALLTLALLLVPDGRLPSPRWRPVAWFVVGSAVLGAVTSAAWRRARSPMGGRIRWHRGHGGPVPTTAGASAERSC